MAVWVSVIGPRATDSGTLRPAPPLPLPARAALHCGSCSARVTPASTPSPLTSQSPLTSPQFNCPFITANDLFTPRIKPRTHLGGLFAPFPPSYNPSDAPRQTRYYSTRVLYDSNDYQKKKKKKVIFPLEHKSPPTTCLWTPHRMTGFWFFLLGGFLVAAHPRASLLAHPSPRVSWGSCHRGHGHRGSPEFLSDDSLAVHWALPVF